MNDPTLTVAATAAEPTPFHRSRSSPDLFLHASTLTPFLSTPSPHDGLDNSLGATYTSKNTSRQTSPFNPEFDLPSLDFGSDIETHLPIETELAKATPSPDEQYLRPFSTRKLPCPMAVLEANTNNLSRSKSIANRSRSWFAITTTDTAEKASLRRRTKKTVQQAKAKNETNAANLVHSTAPNCPSASHRSSSSFADFARKSWVSSSRSPSPKRHKEPMGIGFKAEDGAEEGEPSQHGSLVDPEQVKSSQSPVGYSRALSRASLYIGRLTQKPQERSFRDNTTHLVVTSPGQPTKLDTVSPLTTTGLASENPNPRLSSQTALSSTSDTSSGGTGSTGMTELSQTVVEQTTQKTSQSLRDPMWTTFRRLDSEYASFLCKPTTAQRFTLARNTLIPFLRNHGNHASKKDHNLLSPEDIDRRASILHKWWNGLLELLDGSAVSSSSSAGPATSFAAIQVNTSTANLQPVPGIDRPALLELITMIMMRPEWRLSTPTFRPLEDRPSRTVVRHRRRADTKDSDDFILESAEHNVRTIFVNALLAQMAIVVDKMSSRNASASLVTFCGKACAYAFFFVPGIAEVLVRLWGLKPDLLRRVADEFSLPRRGKAESEAIVSRFPSTLHRLGWTSVKAMTDNLRLTTKLSVVAAQIPWHGPWVSRWRGGDTDLFFIFCKYYYILAESFTPVGLTLVEKAQAPAFALVHAQLLSVLDTTIHRQATFDNMMAPNVLDATNGADAMAAALAQIPPCNLLRVMHENRLIVLLKDMLAENAVGGLEMAARQTFATAFMAVLKAATKRTPVFKQAPVLVLVDFLQEVLFAFDSYAGYTDPECRGRYDGAAAAIDHVDWAFWLEVLHKILFESNSTMSELRTLSFLFSAWDILTADPARKAKLCGDWLLSDQVFDKFFNNYTPMVRAYFMRLLCWRICRDQGRPSELDLKIFSLVSDRLKQVWSRYLGMKETAEATGKPPPSTAPSHPQPGKRFMIIRIEMTPPQPGLLQTGFDTMHGTLNFGGVDCDETASVHASDVSSEAGESTYRKRWSKFGRMLSFGSTATPGAPAVSASGSKRTSVADELDAARRATAASRSAPTPPNKISPSPFESDASSTGSTPVYDAAHFVFKFTLGTLPWSHSPAPDMMSQMGPAGSLLSLLPREHILTRPRLPAPAQATVDSWSDSPSRPAPDLPCFERMYSRASRGGLVSEARNALPPSTDNKRGEMDSSTHSSYYPSLPPIECETRLEFGDENLMQRPGSDDSDRLGVSRGRVESDVQAVQPTKPVGIFKERATYSGRALAEWNIVVNECNSFVDRRRDEGVYGLNDVEVPSLGIENLRRIV